jgi:hypothetical protein
MSSWCNMPCDAAEFQVFDMLKTQKTAHLYRPCGWPQKHQFAEIMARSKQRVPPVVCVGHVISAVFIVSCYDCRPTQ